MTSMSNVAASEWLKLRTIPLHYILVSVGAAFVMVIVVLVAALNGDPEFFFSEDLANLVGVTSVVAALSVSVVSVLAITGEFAHNTIRPTLAAVPDRSRAFLGKGLVLAAVAAAAGAMTAWVPYLVGLVIFNVRGADIGISGDDGSLAILVGLPFFFVLLALFGYGLGLLLRSLPGALAIVILWPLLVEGIIASVLNVAGVDEPLQFLPYQSSFALVTADTDDFFYGRVGGGVFFGLVVLVLIAGGIVVNSRRDV
ncbi:MAG: hypothetical protein AAF945_16780 [Actinomycetota bacterium]